MKIANLILTALFLLILLAICSEFALAEIKPRDNPKAIFTLIKNSDDGKNFTAQLKIDGLPHAGTWELAFNSIRPVVNVDGAEIINLKQGGDFYLVKFIVPEQSNSINLTVQGKYVVKHITDAPQGYFLIENPDSEDPAVKSAAIAVASQVKLPAWQPDPGQDEASRNNVKLHTSIEGNPVDTILTAENTLIVPLPVSLERQPGQFILNANTKIIYDTPEAEKPAVFFAQAIQPATGYALTVAQFNHTPIINNTILLTNSDIGTLDIKQQQEGYILEVKPSTIIIHAATQAGFFYGLQSLRQLLPAAIYSHQFQSVSNWTIPAVYMVDYPRFAYRGVQLDVARHFIDAEHIKRLIDLMAMHKLNYFQWHLTDDEGWRIEIKSHPELTAKGGSRYYDPKKYTDHDLLPAYGSGANRYGGYYTQEQIRDIVAYAEARQITIVPEIDMPGHARAMIMSLPNELIDQSDHSVYTSIQNYHDNVLSPCKKETFAVIDDVMTEVAALFPGKYIHVGGDEVPQGVWQQSCMAKKYNPQDPDFKDKVQNDFMLKVQNIITSKGKVMAGWEELASDNGTLAAPLLVYIWNSGKINQAYAKSLKSGYEVIMGPAENLYFDLAYNADPAEPGQYWAGYVDTFSAYSFAPIAASQSDLVIKGVQGHLWSEMIDSPERLDYLAFPKIAGLSELAWTPAARRNWKNFTDRMKEKHLPRLNHYGVNYRATEF